MTQQLRRTLSQRIRALYEQQLEHQLNEITLHLFDRTLAIVLEGTITKPEQLLKRTNNQALAEQVRNILDDSIKPQIRQVVEEVTGMRVVDFLSDTKIETERTGAIAIFELEPRADR